jgi:hypothetical protein
MEAQHLDERLKVRVSKGRDAHRGNWQGGGSEKVEIMKGPLNALQNVRRNAFKKVVGEAIECTEESSSNRLIVPARWRHGRR